MDGGLVRITRAGADHVIGTSDDQIQTFYLTSDAIKIYQQYPSIKIEILESIPDATIQAFQMANLPADFALTQAPIDQIVSYLESEGYSQADAVNLAQQVRGYTIQGVMDWQNALNAQTATNTQQVINQELAYEQSLLNPAFQTQYDTSVTQSFTQPAGTPILYPSDTFSNIISGLNTGLPQPVTQVNSTPNTPPAIITSGGVIPTTSDQVPAFKMRSSFGVVSYIDDTVHVHIDYKTSYTIPITQAKLIIQLVDQTNGIELKNDTIVIDTKNGSIDKDYVIGNRIASQVRIEAFIWSMDNQVLAEKTTTSTTWQPSTIGKTTPNPSPIIKNVTTQLYKHEKVIIASAVILGTIAGLWYFTKNNKSLIKGDKK